jgi:hypothetical protein
MGSHFWIFNSCFSRNCDSYRANSLPLRIQRPWILRSNGQYVIMRFPKQDRTVEWPADEELGLDAALSHKRMEDCWLNIE